MEKLPQSLTRFFLHFVKKQPLVFVIFVLAPISVILKANIIPYALKMVIDTISFSDAIKSNVFMTLKLPMLIGGGAWLGLTIIERFQSWLQAKSIPKLESEIRANVVDHILSKPYHFFSTQFSGNITSRVSSLVQSISTIRKIITSNILPAFFVVIVALILLFNVSPLFSYIIFSWVFIQTITTLLFIKHINKSTSINAEDKNKIGGLLVDIFSNIVSVKIFSKENYELGLLQDFQKKEESSHSNLIKLINKFCFSMDLCVTITLFTSFYFLIDLWRNDLVTTGDIILVLYMIFAIMNQIWQLGYALADFFRETGVARQAIKSIIENTPSDKLQTSSNFSIRKGEIEFKNVTFGFKDNEKLFHNLNLHIKSGEKVGIVGTSGSGKSTFVNLILRLFELQSGGIFIDGQDIALANIENIRDHISVISQDTNLFHRTVYDNILYGKIEASKEEVLEASRKACCHHFIGLHPENYQTMVGEKGTKLSGGQRQRISVARAFLKPRNLFILDEATSALDSITEDTVQQNLRASFKDKTALIITHRLSTLVEMDRILVFDNGKIIEDGSHTDLLKAQGSYFEMWKNETKSAISLPKLDAEINDLKLIRKGALNNQNGT